MDLSNTCITYGIHQRRLAADILSCTAADILSCTAADILSCTEQAKTLILLYRETFLLSSTSQN